MSVGTATVQIRSTHAELVPNHLLEKAPLGILELRSGEGALVEQGLEPGDALESILTW